MKSKKPKLAGIWVFACTPQGEFMKWGKDGDTVYPFKTKAAALRQAEYISKSDSHVDDVIYILHVFDNGQMKQWYYESPHAGETLIDTPNGPLPISQTGHP